MRRAVLEGMRGDILAVIDHDDRGRPGPGPGPGPGIPGRGRISSHRGGRRELPRCAPGFPVGIISARPRESNIGVIHVRRSVTVSRVKFGPATVTRAYNFDSEFVRVQDDAM